MHLLQLGLFMYSHQNRTLPLKFDCKFTLQKEIHSYHTRNSHLYRLPLCRTNIKQFSVFTSWYVHHTMRYSDGWMSLHSRKQLIYALNPH